jgi:hypothetical protein
MATIKIKPTARKVVLPARADSAGNTQVSIGQEVVPRLPHERDESADSQVSPPRKVMQQAAKDIERGLKDTDRAAEVNATYKKLKV